MSELQQLRDALKLKWEIKNKEYQMFAHLTKFDTVGKRRRLDFFFKFWKGQFLIIY